MQWLDERYAAYGKYQRKRDVARENAKTIFEELFESVYTIVQLANQKDFGLSTEDDDEKSRRVIMEYGPREDRKSRELHINLADDLLSISASSDAGAADFAFYVDTDDRVRLTVERKHLDVRDAAQYIMEPFLFEGKSPYRTT
jgi:hypothetical protein